MIQLHLENAGFDIDSVATAEQAMPFASLADIVVTDLRLPGMSGLELIQQDASARPDCGDRRHDCSWFG